MSCLQRQLLLIIQEPTTRPNFQLVRSIVQIMVEYSEIMVDFCIFRLKNVDLNQTIIINYETIFIYTCIAETSVYTLLVNIKLSFDCVAFEM